MNDSQAKRNISIVWNNLKHREQVLDMEFEKWKATFSRTYSNQRKIENTNQAELDFNPETNDGMKRVDSELSRLKELLLATPALLKETQLYSKANPNPTKDLKEHEKFTPVTMKSKLIKSEHNIKQAHDLSICIHHTLLMQEKTLIQDLKILDIQMKSWERFNTLDTGNKENTNEMSHKSTTHHRTTGFGLTHLCSAVPMEVRMFEKFIRQYGSYGGEGWDSISHSMFLQLKQQIKHPNLFYERCEQILHKSKHELEAHEAWYDKFKELSENKKNAIQQWKQWKKQMQQVQHNCMEKEKASKEHDFIQSASKNSLSSSVSNFNDIQKSLLAWKEKKKREEEVKLEYLEKRKREAKMKEKRKREQKKLQLKQAIEQYHVKKQSQYSTSSSYPQQPKKPFILPKDVSHRIQTQSQRILNKRKPKIGLKKKVFLWKSTSKKKTFSGPSKLFSDTLATSLKKDITIGNQETIKKNIQSKFSVAHTIQNVPKLAKPSWISAI